MTGRDGRKSGEIIHHIVNSVFASMGIDVIDWVFQPLLLFVGEY